MAKIRKSDFETWFFGVLTGILIGSLLLLFVSSAYGQTVSIPERKTIFVSLVNAVGPNSLTDARVLKLFAKIKQHYSEDLNINLELIKFKHTRNRWRQSLDIINRNLTVSKWSGYFRKYHETDKKILKLVILNPIFTQGSYWLAGMSVTTCAYRKFNPISVSNAEEFNSWGAPRFNHSVAAAEHELGHLIGARHDPSLPATIMHPAPLPYLDGQGGEMHFSSLSFNEIYHCINLQ